jgi:hypothetical protein
MTPGFRVPSSPALPVSSSSSASPLSRLVPTVTRLGVTVRGVEPLATSAEPAVSRLGAAARPLGALVSGPVPAVSPVGGTVSRLVPTVSAFVPAARCLVPAVSRRQKAANRLKINVLRCQPILRRHSAFNSSSPSLGSSLNLTVTRRGRLEILKKLFT